MIFPKAASLLDKTGCYLRERAPYAEAEPLLSLALSINERKLGAEHLDTANSLNNIAGLYKSQGKYEQAEPLYVRALAICENFLGQNHPSTRAVRANYTILLMAMENDGEAREREEGF